MPRDQDPDRATMMRLRRGIGAIGIGLPFALLLGVHLAGVPMENSISEFFFSELREVFVAAAAGVGLFLLAYEGYPPRPKEILTDRRVSGLAGASVLVMAFVPTLCARGTCAHPPTLFDRLIPASADTTQAAIHLTAAGLFLLSLGIMSQRVFTRCTRPSKSLFKQRRNLCYQIFGWVIFTMVGVIGVMKLGFPNIGHHWDTQWHFTFWAESVAVWAFGLSWLMKGAAMQTAMPYLFGKGAD
ncbi:hypothetical protein [Aliiroseovarius lamellibrachiae]|uniref:hypothetical protein n=1 Tax=Aliiroseovarius lamellibrachiae TaxID=1924933 RepID=UPI001BE0425F|nr:hypothetical protein [Aliiroseovarius lamellibrachiae]MBT2132205.1 hypothetical protein [Aliiroseovarius lamellibrachiae]